MDRNSILRGLMKEYDLSSAKISELIGKKRTTVYSYRSDDAKISVESLAKICEFVGRQLSEFVDDEDQGSSAGNLEPENKFQDYKLTTGQKIKILLMVSGMSVDDLAVKLNRSRQAVSHYLNDRFISFELTQELADVFNVPPIYFIDDVGIIPTKRGMFIEQRLDALTKRFNDLEKKILKMGSSGNS